MKLALFLIMFLLSASVVGVEVMAPILTDGRLTSVIPAQRLLESWLLSLIALTGFAYNLGMAHARRELLSKGVES